MLTTLASLFLGGVTVILPMETKVRGTELTLADVAEVSGEDPALVAAAKRVSLGYVPSPGYSRLLDEAWIRQRMNQALPDAEIRFTGQPRTRVWPLVERIGAERLRLAAETEIKRLIGTEDASFELASPILDMLVPAGVEGAVLRANAPGDRLASGALAIPVQVLVDGTPYRTLWATFQVQVWHTVPVLRRSVRAGERLTDEHFERRRVLRQESQRGMPLPVDALFGATAARDIPMGSVVSAPDVHRPVAIEQGRAVVMQVRKGSVVARVPGTARDTASIGDRVRVIAVESGAELVGVVRSRDLVEIHLGN